MLEPMRRPLQRLHRVLFCSLLLGCGFGATSLAGCGARSSTELFELSPAGGAAAWPNTPGGAPTTVAGAPAVVRTPAVAGASARGGAPTKPPPACEAVTVAIDELRPALTLVVDQSLSMSFRYPDNDSPATRWSIVGDALFEPMNGVVKRFDASVRFGIAFFTSWRDNCPILNQVPAQARNYEALNSLYRSLSPSGDTPTGEALQQIVSELERIPSLGPRSILLVTDGNPDTCAKRRPDEGQPEAVAAAQRAHEAGIDLYVLGISNGIAGQNLQQLANAGLGRPIDLIWGVDPGAAQPFQANDNVLGLTAQLSDLLNRIPLCEVRLQRDVELAEVSNGQVLLDGQRLGYGSVDGYVLKDPRHLAIVGRACDAIKAGKRQLSVRISCD